MKNLSKKFQPWSLVAAAVCALAAAAAGAQTTAMTTTAPTAQSTALDKLIAQYSLWAGSQSNAKALVQGLNIGTSVTLSSGAGTGSNAGTATTFTPVTSKLGVGEVNIALSLAKASLAQQGITNPTPAQVSAALNGGVVTSSTSSTSLVGVLAQRQSGSGWGEIAHALGVKLGSVVSASKTEKSKAGAEYKSEHSSNKNKDERSQGSEHAHNREASASGRSNQGGGNSSGGGGGGGGKK